MNDATVAVTVRSTAARLADSDYVAAPEMMLGLKQPKLDPLAAGTVPEVGCVRGSDSQTGGRAGG